MNVCKYLDEFIIDKDETIWVVELSNGEKIYQDDGRYGFYDKAWLRLMDYCYNNNLKILKLWITFRSHTEFIFENDGDGIFFRQGILAQIGYARKLYIFGIVKDDKIYAQYWRIPEVIWEDSVFDKIEVRPVEGNESTIIWNKKP